MTTVLKAVIVVVIGLTCIGATPPQGPLQVVVNEFYGSQTPIVIEGRTFVPTGPGQTGLTIVLPESPAVTEITVILRDLTFKPGFTNCILLVNAWNARLENIDCDGAYGGDSANGIVLIGASHNVHIRDCRLAHLITGVYIPGPAEGTLVDGCTIEGVTHGVFSDALTSEIRRPSLWITNTHIAASRAGIVAFNRTQVTLRDNLIYQHLRNKDWSVPFEGIILAGGTDDVEIQGGGVVCRPGPVEQYPGLSVALTAVIPPLKADFYRRACD